MRVAVIGGGINGVMSAWALARRGCDVTLFERDGPMQATSAASTKLLHGGIRYLEMGEFRLVRESLRERTWWIQQAPHLAHPLRILLPIYQNSRRARWIMRIGLALYDLLAGAHKLGRTYWMSAAEVLACTPQLKARGLLGAYAFHDGQMDDAALGLWAAEQACTAGVQMLAHHPVIRISTDGHVVTADGTRQHFDRLLNVAGPWAGRLLEDSNIPSGYRLDLVRGSHLLVDRALQDGLLLEVPDSTRVAFVLPYAGKTLIGTTEIRQTLDEPIACSAQERTMLTALHDHYLDPPLNEQDSIATFAGLRPLLRTHANPTQASREYALEKRGALVTVYGGKWTTSRALGEKAANALGTVPEREV